MDNRVFNVNGAGEQMLLRTLELVFEQEGSNCRAHGWIQSKTHGLILVWHADSARGDMLFPTDKGLTAKGVLPVVLAWLDSDFAKQVKLTRWDEDADHNGSNSLGWRVYCEDWGHVADNHYAICAIKPAYMWHGK